MLFKSLHPAFQASVAGMAREYGLSRELVAKFWIESGNSQPKTFAAISAHLKAQFLMAGVR